MHYMLGLGKNGLQMWILVPGLGCFPFFSVSVLGDTDCLLSMPLHSVYGVNINLHI